MWVSAILTEAHLISNFNFSGMGSLVRCMGCSKLAAALALVRMPAGALERALACRSPSLVVGTLVAALALVHTAVGGLAVELAAVSSG